MQGKLAMRKTKGVFYARLPLSCDGADRRDHYFIVSPHPQLCCGGLSHHYRGPRLVVAASISCKKTKGNRGLEIRCKKSGLCLARSLHNYLKINAQAGREAVESEHAGVDPGLAIC